MAFQPSTSRDTLALSRREILCIQEGISLWPLSMHAPCASSRMHHSHISRQGPIVFSRMLHRSSLLLHGSADSRATALHPASAYPQQPARLCQCNRRRTSLLCRSRCRDARPRASEKTRGWVSLSAVRDGSPARRFRPPRRCI